MEYGLVRLWAPHYGVGSFLVCIALVLSLSFSSGVLWGVEREIVLGHILGPLRGFRHTSSAVGLLGLSFGPLMWSGLGFQISGPTRHIEETHHDQVQEYHPIFTCQICTKPMQSNQKLTYNNNYVHPLGFVFLKVACKFLTCFQSMFVCNTNLFTVRMCSWLTLWKIIYD